MLQILLLFQVIDIYVNHISTSIAGKLMNYCSRGTMTGCFSYQSHLLGLILASSVVKWIAINGMKGQ